MKTGLLSIHEPYALAILSGEKQYEFRRKAPKLDGPTRFLIYATTPRKELIGEMVVDHIVRGTPEAVWRRTREHAGIDRATFFAYFEDADEANALHVLEARRYGKPLALSRLRELVAGFTPPQYLTWLPPRRVETLRHHAGRERAAT